MRKKKWILAVATVLASSTLMLNACGKNEGTEASGEEGGALPMPPQPPGQDFNGEKNFAHLINHYARGKPEKMPWVGFWWPYKENGIAAGKYGSGLSPAGKYDAARGGTTSAQSWEIKHHGSGVPKVQGWWGHCNGWCAAAALYPEPTTDKKVNGINFTVGDIKGLLTEAAMEVSADFYGNRVDWSNDYNNGKYEDIIPNQYFLVLTNYMGASGKAVLLDRYTGDQVWNQPGSGYEFDYPKPSDVIAPDSSNPNVWRVNMTSRLWWGRDDVGPGDISEPFNYDRFDTRHYQVRELKLELWLDGPVEFDAEGKIVKSGNVVVAREGEKLVGGAWKNGGGLLADGHPDYMWVPYTILEPAPTPEGEEPYRNVHIDHKWIEQHILTGVDDTTVRPASPTPAPPPSRRPRDRDDDPTPNPTGTSTSTPWPWPWPQPTATTTTTPQPQPTSPQPQPTSPQPQPTETNVPQPQPTRTSNPGPRR